MYNNKYFIQFIKERNLKKSTVEGYQVVLKLYCDINEMNLNEIMLEAQDEEIVCPLKNRSIKKRLISFRNFLISQNKSHNTIKTYLSKIFTFYRHFEIELPVLPPVKYDKGYQINYSDLPSKEDIANVLNLVPISFQALILFMSSSGCSKAETLSLTINDFIKGCENYYRSDNLKDILNELSIVDNLVPTIYLKRIKTGKYYFTFCSSEASQYIIKYLKTRNNLSLSEKLFPFSSSKVTSMFQKINDNMQWGRKGYYRFFRSHVLRKYHASNIGLPAEYIDVLQGRQKSIVHEAYIKTNPEELKKLYIKHMNNVIIFNSKENSEKEKVEDIHITINIFLSDMQLTL